VPLSPAVRVIQSLIAEAGRVPDVREVAGLLRARGITTTSHMTVFKDLQGTRFELGPDPGGQAA
jgi:hypothetical protein